MNAMDSTHTPIYLDFLLPDTQQLVNTPIKLYGYVLVLSGNTDALKDLGSAPMVQGDAPASVVGGGPVLGARPEPTGLNVAFAVFGVIAALFMIFIALVAVTDYFNIWHPSESGRVDLPIISDHVYSNITTKK